MGKLITVKKAVDGKVIVESKGALPVVYESFTEMVVNEFCPSEVRKVFKESSCFEVYVNIDVNPPKDIECIAWLRRKAKSLGWIKGETPLTLEILERMKKTAKKEKWRQLKSWERKMALAETLMRMP